MVAYLGGRGGVCGSLPWGVGVVEIPEVVLMVLEGVEGEVPCWQGVVPC